MHACKVHACEVHAGVSSCRRSGRSEAEMSPRETVAAERGRRLSRDGYHNKCKRRISSIRSDTTIYDSISTLTRRRAPLPSDFPTRDQLPLFLLGKRYNHNNRRIKQKDTKLRLVINSHKIKYFGCEGSSIGQESQAC